MAATQPQQKSFADLIRRTRIRDEAGGARLVFRSLGFSHVQRIIGYGGLLGLVLFVVAIGLRGGEQRQISNFLGQAGVVVLLFAICLLVQTAFQQIYDDVLTLDIGAKTWRRERGFRFAPKTTSGTFADIEGIILTHAEGDTDDVVLQIRFSRADEPHHNIQGFVDVNRAVPIAETIAARLNRPYIEYPDSPLRKVHTTTDANGQTHVVTGGSETRYHKTWFAASSRRIRR